MNGRPTMKRVIVCLWYTYMYVCVCVVSWLVGLLAGWLTGWDVRLCVHLLRSFSVCIGEYVCVCGIGSVLVSAWILPASNTNMWINMDKYINAQREYTPTQCTHKTNERMNENWRKHLMDTLHSTHSHTHARIQCNEWMRRNNMRGEEKRRKKNETHNGTLDSNLLFFFGAEFFRHFFKNSSIFYHITIDTIFKYLLMPKYSTFRLVLPWKN